MNVDVVLDLSRGDSSKGKVVHSLLKEKKYDLVLKTSGSANAGHTIYHDGHKFITHLIPAGVFYGVESVIGRNCLVHPKTFLGEIKSLQERFNEVESLKDINVSSLVKIDKNTFIISEEHIEEDSKDTKIGTTKKGTGPAARDKYARTSKQAKDIPELKDYLVDFFDYFHKGNINILCEGAQGFYLDPHFGEYPYLTSCHCSIAAVMLCGIPMHAINKIYGVIKAYETYVGSNKFEGDDPIFQKMRDIGEEYGSTTGRPRQCNYLNIDEVELAVYVNSVNELIVNKMDVLKEIDCWKVRAKIKGEEKVIDFKTEKDFKEFLVNVAIKHNHLERVRFSSSKEGIKGIGTPRPIPEWSRMAAEISKDKNKNLDETIRKAERERRKRESLE